MSLIAQRYAALFDTVALVENRKVQAARERIEHLVHTRQHEMVFLHVRAAHVLGKPRCRGLVLHEIIGPLRAVSERELLFHVEIRGLFHHLDEIPWRDLSQHVARPLRFTHVALDESAACEAHGGELFTRVEMDDGVFF